jgi:hypothetical protein
MLSVGCQLLEFTTTDLGLKTTQACSCIVYRASCIWREFLSRVRSLGSQAIRLSNLLKIQMKGGLHGMLTYGAQLCQDALWLTQGRLHQPYSN